MTYLKLFRNVSVFLVVLSFYFIGFSSTFTDIELTVSRGEITGLTKFDQDTIPPSFDIDTTITAKVKTYVCSADIEVPWIKNLSDDSDPNPRWWITANQGTISGDINNNGYIDSLENWEIKNIPLGEYEICYHAIDISGNESTECIPVHIVDLTPPIASCVHFLSISIADDGIGKINANDFNSGSFDNCNHVFFKALRTSSNGDYDGKCTNVFEDNNPATDDVDVWYNDFVSFCCEDVDSQDVFVTMRVFDIDPSVGGVNPERMKPEGDLYGHFSECWSFVQVTNLNPIVISCPAVTLACNESSDPQINTKLLPELNIECGIDLNYSDSTLIDDKDKIIRTWTATSSYESVKCVQEITNNPVEIFDPCAIVFPEDSISDCSFSPENKPIWNDFVCTPVSSKLLRQDTFIDANGIISRIEREWAVIDSSVFKQNTGAEDNIDIINGNKLDCEQLVNDGYYRYTQTLIPSFDPCSIVFPADIVEGCKDYSFQKPVWDESTCGTVTFELIAVDKINTTDLEILKKWVVIDRNSYKQGSGAENNVDSLIGNKLDCQYLVEDGYYSYSQHIKYSIDDTAPDFDVADSIVVEVNDFDCSLETNIPLIQYLEDNCDDKPKWWVTTDSGILSGDINSNGFVDSDEVWVLQTDDRGIYPITYHAIDIEDNESQKQSVLNIIDNRTPIALCERFHLLRLTAMGRNLLEAIDLNAGSYDNCNPVFYKVSRNTNNPEGDESCQDLNGDDNPATDKIDIWYDDEVYFCCQDLNKVIPVVLRVFDKDPGDGPVEPERMEKGGDLYGHYNACQTKITVEYTIPPYIDCSPVTVHCGESYNPDINPKILPFAASACGYTLSYQDSLINPGDYSGTFTRIWTISANGFSAKCEQSVTIDTSSYFDPCTIIFPKSDTIYGCKGVLDDIPFFYNPGCANVTYELQSEDTLFETGDLCMQIIREWAVIDWDTYQADPDGADYNVDSIIGNKLDCSHLVADGFYRYTQVISVIDYLPPVIFARDTCISTLDCYAYDIKVEASATSECSNEKINWKYIVTNMDTWETVQYSYNYTPVPISGAKGKQSKDNLDNTIDASLLILNPLPKGNYRVTWTAGGLCGNANSINHYFTINDNKTPTPILFDESFLEVNSNSFEITARQFDKGGCPVGCIASVDNCSRKDELFFSFTDKLPEIWKDTTKWKNQLLEYGEYYFDPKTGKISSQLQYLKSLADAYVPELNTTKRIIWQNGEVNNIPSKVYVWDQFAYNDDCNYNNFDYGNIHIFLEIDHPDNIFGKVSYINDSTGFSGMQMKAFNGGLELIDTTDNGAFAFGEPDGEIFISGNSNSDYYEGLSTRDLILLHDFLLKSKYNSSLGVLAMDIDNSGIIDAYDILTLRKNLLRKTHDFEFISWVAVSKKYINLNSNKIPKPINRAFIDTVIMENGVPDHNPDFYALKMGDADLSANKDSSSISKPDISFWVKNSLIKKDSTILIPFFIENVEDVRGFQFTLELSDVELDTIKPGKIVSPQIYNVVDNKALFLWTDMGASFDKDEVLFYLKLKAKSDIYVKDALKLSGSFLSPEIYTGEDIDIHELKFIVKGIDATNNMDNAKLFVLYQNKPNPFNRHTVIGFKTNTVSEYKMTFYNLTGKIVKTIIGISRQGYNSIDISNSDIPNKGVIFYKLETAGNITVKKMIRL